MKTILLLTLALNTALAFGACDEAVKINEIVVNQDINSAPPKGLEEATITVTQPNGKSSTVSMKDFKVVLRKQQFKTVRAESRWTTTCTQIEKDKQKNLLLLGARKDTIGYSKQVNANSATISTKKDAVLDLQYVREKVLGNAAAGLGVDTNGTPKAVIGLEF